MYVLNYILPAHHRCYCHSHQHYADFTLSSGAKSVVVNFPVFSFGLLFIISFQGAEFCRAGKVKQQYCQGMQLNSLTPTNG